MKCSVCSSEINEKYCSKCGQYYKGGRINSITFLGDLFQIFSDFFLKSSVLIITIGAIIIILFLSLNFGLLKDMLLMVLGFIYSSNLFTQSWTGYL